MLTAKRSMYGSQKSVDQGDIGSTSHWRSSTGSGTLESMQSSESGNEEEITSEFKYFQH